MTLRLRQFAARIGPLLALEGWRAGAGIAAFVVAARTFGVEEYGAVIVAYSVSAIAFPLVTLGSVELAVRSGALGQFPAHLRSSATRVAPRAVAVSALPLLISTLLGDASGGLLILVICLAELLPGSILALCSSGGIGMGRLRVGAVIGALPLLIRLVTLTVAATVGSSALAWSIWNVALLLAACIPAARVSIRLQPVTVSTLEDDASGGVAIAVNSTLTMVSNNSDTLLLAALNSNADAGRYGAQYRLVQYCMVPGRALLAANLALMYATHSRSARIRLATSCVVRAAIATLLLGVVAGVAGRFLLPSFGPGFEFEPVIFVILGLSFALKTIGYGLGDLWTVAGLQGRRTALQALATTGALISYLTMIPRWGSLGAASGTMIGEVVFLTALWSCRRDVRDRQVERVDTPARRTSP